MHHLVVPPEADLHELLGGVWYEMDVDLFMEGLIGHLDLMVEERDTAIAIDHASTHPFAQAEDILGRGVGLGQDEFVEDPDQGERVCCRHFELSRSGY